MASVELKNVSKYFGGGVAAVDNQSLLIHEHEFLALLGPSGCGKTTALRMIAGLENPTAGQIFIGGEDVTAAPPQARDVAMVFQNYGLYPHMTVAANIAYPLRVRKTAAAEIEKRVYAAAAKTHIEKFLQRKPRQLSGGQRQRVALARAIVRRPRVFLMDEPLSNLDAQLRASMRAELQHLSRELRVTTVYVTHDQIEAMTLADRVAVMCGGKIRQLAPPQEIFDNPADLFVAGFIGGPPMNLIPGSLRGGTFENTAGSVTDVGGGDLPAAVLGVRPEDLRITTVGGGDFDAAVYACERTGEHTLITVEIAGTRITAKGGRALAFDIGAPIALAVNRQRLCLFDPATDKRIAR